MAIDSLKVESCIRELLTALGDDPNREGLLETPQRVAKMYEEVFEGMNYTNEEIAQMFHKTFEVYETNCEREQKDIVFMKDIDAFSFCEHHLALMYDMKISIAYVPKNRVIGLSKIARIADMVCKRLQLQERIGEDISEIMKLVTKTDDVAVLISGSHSCMTARGIKNVSAVTKTITLHGVFQKDPAMEQKLYFLLQS